MENDSKDGLQALAKFPKAVTYFKYRGAGYNSSWED